MWREAVVGSSLYCQPNTSCAALLAELDCLMDIARRVARQSVMQVADKVVSVVKWQRHEGTTHQNKFHLHGPVHVKPCLLIHCSVMTAHVLYSGAEESCRAWAARGCCSTQHACSLCLQCEVRDERTMHSSQARQCMHRRKSPQR